VFNQYFGNYLLNKKIITAEELKEILTYQKSNHVKIGVLAINFGYMNSEQVLEVHKQQMQMDKRFGEIAIQLGYLNEKQLQNLLSAQREGYLQLSQALIDKKILTYAQLANTLENYKKECQFTNEDLEIIQQGDLDKIVNLFLKFEYTFCGEVFRDYTVLMLKNIVRLLDETPCLETPTLANNYKADWLIFQEVHGKSNLFTGIATNERMFLTIASKFAGRKFTIIDEMTKAAVTEFLNVHNGIFLVNMSNQNIELEMNAPMLYEKINIIDNTETHDIPLSF
jgi:hypothetical protein